MKFLDLSPLSRLDQFLEHIDCGNTVVYGDLEAYSCKLAGLDKKLSKSLDNEVQMEGTSPLEMSKSPVGPLAESSSRKTLIFLILTLNNIYPDYDFSTLRAHHFIKEDGLARVEECIDSHLLEVSKVWSKTPGLGETPFLECLWTSIDEAITIAECDIYTYRSDLESDPFGEASVWAFNYFFYNKKMKRILYLSCRAKSKASAEEEESETISKQYYDDDSECGDAKYGMANEMDV